MKTSLLPLLIFACSYLSITLNAQEESSYSLLWKIEKEGMAEPSYLFGTMHVQDERAFNFSDSVMVNLERCSQFAMELHPDSMMSAIYDKVFEQDTSNYFKENLSEEEYALFLEKFSKDKGYNFEDLENKNPITVKTLTKRKVSYNADRSTFVDMHLCGVAKTYGKSIHGLESTENQLLNQKESALQQIRFYLYADVVDTKQQEEQLANTYKEGDIKRIEKIVGKRILTDPHFVKRNTDMVNSLIELMNVDPTFAAVGAAHLVGKKSVISMLEEKGYLVSKVDATFTGVADTYKIDPSMFPWEPFINEDAGVMLNFPGHVKYIKQTFEHPDDPSLDSTDIHLWICTDLTNMTNYIFAYNDFPVGYFVDDIQESFDAIEEELLLTSEKLSPTTTIYQKGVEGRQVDLNLRKTTYARLHTFIRGNRVYKFLVQNLNQSDNRIPENEFLSNVQFLPYKIFEPILNTEGSDLFDFMEFSASVAEPDTIVDYSVFTENNISYYSTNPSSGGLYFTISEKMMKYYRGESRDSFYNLIVDGLVSWTDTIINRESILANDSPGMEYVIKGKDQNAYKRYRINLIGEQMIVQMAFADSIELFGPIANTFFDGLKLKKPATDFDLTASKSKFILEDLKSRDTIRNKKALGALNNYYYFKEEEISELKDATSYHYSRDTSDSGVATVLLNEFGVISDSTQVEFLQNLYKTDEATSLAKCDLLKTILSLGDTTVFLNLFFEDIPEELSSSYAIMGPFSDSLDLGIQYYDQLLPLMEKETYRAGILGLSNRMLVWDSSTTASQEKVKKNYDELVAYRSEDLEEYKQETQKEDNYFWPSKMQYYLTLSPHKQDANLQQFLDEVVTVDTSEVYIKSLSVASRFAHDMKVDQSLLDTLLGMDDYIYDVISFADKYDKIDLLPDSLQSKSTQVFYKGKSFLYGDDVSPDSYDFLGTIDIDKIQYYVYNFSDEYYYGDGDNIHLLVVGGSGSKKTFSLKDAKAHYFEIGEKDTKKWKEKVKANMEDFNKFAY